MELIIQREDGEGRGIGFAQGKAAFVPGAMEGERVSIRVRKEAARHIQAELVQVLDPSPERATPPCPYVGSCGGCAMQHMAYPRQLTQKAARVRDCLARIGRLEEGAYQALPPLGMEHPWRYRNKGIAHIQGGEIGFYGEGTHDLVRVQDCLLQGEHFAPALEATRRWLAQGGEAESLLLRRTKDGQIMAALQTQGNALAKGDAWAALMREAVSAARSLLHGKADGSYRVLWGEPALQDELLGIRSEVSPLDFRQVNAAQAEALYAAALDFAGLTGTQRVIDAYCGAGTLTQLLAAKAREALGIEIASGAVRAARASAERNGYKNVEFLEGACEALLPGLPCDVLVLDPPRKGCDSRVLDAALQAAPGRIVYISCDPATLARDAARLAAGGYRLEKLQVVDMFPWTGHVECVVSISKTGESK